MLGQPQPITDLLFGRIENLWKLNRQPSEIELLSLKRDANKLMQSDAAAAYLALAAIATFAWDIETINQQIDKAMRLKCDVVTLLNAALTLRVVNQRSEAANYALRALELAPNDKDVVDRTVKHLYNMGFLNKAHEIVQSRKRMNLELDDLQETLDQSNRCLVEVDVSEEQLQKEIALALDVLTKKKIRLVDLLYEKFFFHDDGEFCLIIRLNFYGDLETEIELDCLLADRLIDLPEWDLSKLSIQFHHLPNPS